MDARVQHDMNGPRHGSAEVDGAALIDLRRIWGIIRRRALIISVSMAVAAFLAALAYLSAEPRYVATAQVALDRSSERVVNVDQVVPMVDPDSPAVDTEVEILRSPELVIRVVDQLGLARDPEFGGATATTSGAPDAAAQRRAIGVVLGGLQVKRAGLSYAISVSYESPDPVMAARIANEVARQYLLGQVDTKAGATQRASAFLEGKLSDLRAQVLAAEQAVVDFRAANDLYAVSAGSSVTQEQMSNLSLQLAQSQAESAAAQARLDTVRAQLRRGRSGEELGEALDSPVVSQLRAQSAQIGRDVAALEQRYGGQHPELLRAREAQRNTDAAIAAEVNRIVANTTIQANIARQRAASLAATIRQAEGQLSADSAASVRLNELERNAESARTLYQTFLDRYRQTVAQSGLERSDSYLIAQARVPGRPSSPKLLIYVAAAIVGGLAVAAVLVLLLQLLEGGLETSDAVERRLALPTLATIPDLATLPGRARGAVAMPPAEVVVRNPQSLFSEAFRSLRTSILFASPSRGSRVIAITSAMPGEGKTTTAICLMRSAALSGMRTVLVDCDLRRRAATRQLAAGTMTGLTELLAGDATIDDVLVKDDASGGWLLPQRLDLVDTQLTDGAAFANLLAALRQRFDLILLDTAPALAVDEARVMASMADGVVCAVRWRKTPAKAAELALRRLHGVDAHVLGVVLTQVNVQEQARSGFGDAAYIRQYKQYHAV